jgi:Tfp pilus assembly protein PilF
MKVLKRITGWSVAMVFVGSAAQAQTTADARKALDAELYAKAISSLKQLITAKPTEGENYFLLGEAYLKNEYPDSAKTAFQNGATAAPKYALNFAGLGAVDLENGNTSAAKANFDLALSKADGKKDSKPNLYVGRAYLEAPQPDFNAALPYLETAMAMNPKDAEAALAMGVAQRGAGDNSAAYSSFGKAMELDKSLTRAKLEQAISVKMAKAFKEAADQFSEIIAADPDYAPAYRELAETYYNWFNSTSNAAEAEEKIKLAVQTYEKYMDHSDRSVEKRLRYADYLYLAKDFKNLEIQANEMAKMDKANLRYLRYQGLAALQNGNYVSAIQSLKDFIAKVETKRIIALDYLNLGRAQLKAEQVDDAIGSFRTAVKMDSSIAESMSPFGAEYFKAAKYDKAADFYEMASNGPKAKAADRFYLGYSYFFAYRDNYKLDTNTSKDILVKADTAFSNVLKVVPATAKAWLYRAKISRLMDEKAALEGAMMPFYEKVVEVLEAKGTAVTDDDKKDLVESYNNLGAFYASTDKVKAIEYFGKTIAIDPANAYATATAARLAEDTSAAATPAAQSQK